jgi:hypothetical protein
MITRFIHHFVPSFILVNGRKFTARYDTINDAAKYGVTKGGKNILVQNENYFCMKKYFLCQSEKSFLKTIKVKIFIY